MESLDDWIELQYHRSAAGMMRSISSDVVKTRPGFGQTIVPHRGSIVASPIDAAYDPEPDYFFHWYRDSAIVIDALRSLTAHPSPGIDAAGAFVDFIRFSHSLRSLDGRLLVASPQWRNRVAPTFERYLRDDADLSAVHDASVLAETRVNADGTLDPTSWPRPQHDGCALRALAVMRWLASTDLDVVATTCATKLLLADLESIHRHSLEACYDIWEEEKGLHYYTLRLSSAALRLASDWWERQDEPLKRRECRRQSLDLLRVLDGYWDDEGRYFKSRRPGAGGTSAKELDFSVIFAAIHAGPDEVAHSPSDPRMHATMSRLEGAFAGAYAINRSRPADHGPAMGRYLGDVYFSGGAYYFSTLGAAEFYYQAALAAADPAPLIERGDGFLRTVRAYTPANGELSEQFDQTSGVQTSARQLAWSHAAFISCVAARRAAVTRSPPCAGFPPPRSNPP